MRRQTQESNPDLLVPETMTFSNTPSSTQRRWWLGRLLVVACPCFPLGFEEV